MTPQKTNPKTHKKIGKPVLSGYQFIFDIAMNSSITNLNDYQVQIYVPAKPIVPPSAAPSRPVNLGLGDLVLIVTCLYTAVW